MKRTKSILVWLATLTLLIIICLPGLWVVLSSMRDSVEILAKPPVWIPASLNFSNYTDLFYAGEHGERAVPVMRYFWNSLIISLVSTAISLFFGMMGGYAFARYQFKGKNKIFLWFMLSRTIPGISLSLPLFIIMSRMGIIDTKAGIIIVYVALNLPFTIWLADGYFRQLPKEMSEAARIDGCTRLQAFLNVELPLCKSGIATAGIFAFLISWNEYAIVSNLSRSVDSKTLTVGLMDFTAQFTVDWAGMCTLAVVIIIPALIFTFLIQKHLISGLTVGGVKG